MTVNLDDILGAEGRRPGRPPGRAPWSDARKLEQSSRRNAARNLVWKAMTRLHPDDFRDLFEQALAKVNAERGPLPGDEATS